MAKVRVVEGGKSAERRLLEKICKDVGIDVDRAGEHGIVPLTAYQVEQATGFGYGPGVGFEFAPGAVYRVRLCHPKGKQKYAQRAGSAIEVLEPRGHGASRAWADPELATLFVTEGEKKAHALTALGFPTLGVCGVWMWIAEKGSKALHPTLERYRARAQQVAVVYDSNRVDNPDVAQAEGALVRALRDAGSKVLVLSVPKRGEEEQGIDDHLARLKTVDERRAEVLRMLAEASDVEHDLVLRCNERWKLIRNKGGGGPYVLEGTGRLSLTAHDQMYKAYKEMLVGPAGKPVPTRVTEWWRIHPLRAEHEKVAFHTSRERPLPPRELNLYVPPTAPLGYRAPSMKPVEVFLEHALPDPVTRRHVLSWNAYCVQKGERPKWCVFCWGTQGTSKTFLGVVLGACYGPYYKPIEFGDLNGDFGKKRFENTRFLHADEGGPDPKAGIVLANKLKHALTSPTLLVNEKYVPAYPIDNRALVYLSSNWAESLHVEPSDRRTFVVRMFEKLPAKVTRDMNVWLRGDESIEAPVLPSAAWALWEFFDAYEVEEGFNPNDAPGSTEKEDLIGSGRSMLERNVHALVSEGTWFGRAMREVVSLEKLVLFAGAAEMRETTSDPEGSVWRKLVQAGCLRRPVKVPGEGKRNLWAVRNVARWAAAPGTAWAAEYAADAQVPGSEVPVPA